MELVVKQLGRANFLMKSTKTYIIWNLSVSGIHLGLASQVHDLGSTFVTTLC